MRDFHDMDEVRDRSLRRWNENGLEQLVLGLFCCALGGIYLLGGVLTTGSMIGRNYAMIAPLLQMVCTLAMVVALTKLRARLVFPRTGYAVLRPGPSRQWTLLAAVGVILAMGVAAVLRMPTFDDIAGATGPAYAVVVAACFAWGWLRYRIQHWMLLAAWSVGLGIWSYRTGAPAEWLLVGIGAAMALAGAPRLRSFLKSHPIAEDQDE